MHDCLSRTRAVAPMTPRITQMTSYQRDVPPWRGAEILAPHRQPWTGPAFITAPPVPFPLTDGVICGWVEQVSTVPAAGYRKPQLSLHCMCLLQRALSLLLHILSAVSLQLNIVKSSSLLAGSWYDSQLSFQRIYACIVLAGVSALKQEAPGFFVVVGSSAAIPTEISVAWILDSRKANKRGFHMKSPEQAATVSSHIPYTLPSGNRSYLCLSRR